MLVNQNSNSNNSSLSLHQSQKGTQSTDTTLTEDLKVVDPPTGIALASTSRTRASLTQYISRDDVLSAEVLWAIKTVMLHYFYEQQFKYR